MNAVIAFRGKAGQTHKRCPKCEQTLILDAFWSDPSHWDGLFTYCIPCEKARRRTALERKQKAREQIALAGITIREAAEDWDKGVDLLVNAWKRIMEADTAVRLNRQAAGCGGIDGRMEARLVHQRAAFGLNLALADANFPMPFSVLRECGLQPRLVDYIGQEPEQDYLGGDIVTTGDNIDAVQEGCATPQGGGQASGQPESSDPRPSGDGTGRARGRRRNAVPADAGH